MVLGRPGGIWPGRPNRKQLNSVSDLDAVWKALADPTRREILDLLREGPCTTSEIVARFPRLTRFGVMKHIDVLRQAGLVNTRTDGRRRLNTLNPVPIRQIYERWVSAYEAHWASQLLGLKKRLEGAAPEKKSTEQDH